MPQVLQLAHFVQDHGVPDVDIGGGGVQPQFDAQGLPGGLAAHQFAHPIGLGDQLVATPAGHGQRVLRPVGQRHILGL